MLLGKVLQRGQRNYLPSATYQMALRVVKAGFLTIMLADLLVTFCIVFI